MGTRDKYQQNVGKIFAKPKEIRSYQGHSAFILPTTFIGIEVEMEGLKIALEEDENSYWAHHTDNSLRNTDESRAIEFVLKYPLCGEDLFKSLEEFKTFIKALETPPEMSFRTSVHIHMDARDMTEEDLLRFIILYCVLEKVLFNFCGQDRENNSFCLPFYKAEGVIFENLGEISLKGLSSFSRNLGPDNRYAALNLCALPKFGSVEFRHCAGTYDVEFIKKWINVIMSMKKYCMERKFDITVFPAYISDLRYVGLLKDVFGETLNLNYPEAQKDILFGIRHAQKILHHIEMIENPHKIYTVIWAPPTSAGSSLSKYIQARWGSVGRNVVVKTRKPGSTVYGDPVEAPRVSEPIHAPFDSVLWLSGHAQ